MRKNTTIELGITYVGIDAHKKEHRIYILYPGEEFGKEMKIKNHPQEIKRMVKKIKKNSSGPVRMCYEAGACGFALQRQIEACGAKCVVIAPSHTPVKKGERVKTDRRDAKKLAEMDRAKLLTEVAPPNLEEEGVRDFCRLREAAKHDQTRARHQLDKFLLRLSYTYKEGRNWTKKHLDWIRSLKMETAFLQEVFDELLVQVEYCTERVARLDRRLEEMAQEEAYKKEVGWLRCFHGIDTVTATALVAELFRFERFNSPRELMAYLGLTPSEESSGEKIRKGSITKAGNRRVRRLLIEAAWQYRHRPTSGKALKTRREGQPEWVIQTADKARRRLYNRYWMLVRRGKPSGVATTAIARELVGFLWSVMYTKVEMLEEAA